MPLTESIGAATVNGLAYVGGLARLTGESARAVFVGPFRGKPLRLGRAIHQAMAIGMEALPIISLISFFIGVILALQGAYELRSSGAMQLVASAVAISMTRELGPLMTAIVVIGRSGSAFAAEIGTMKVNEEIDALETMAFEPGAVPGGTEISRHDVSCCRASPPGRTSWALWAARFSASPIPTRASPGPPISIPPSDALAMRDIVTGLIKSIMFGVVITAVGCLEGFSTGLGSEQVGRSTTSAVVKSIFAGDRG